MKMLGGMRWMGEAKECVGRHQASSSSSSSSRASQPQCSAPHHSLSRGWTSLLARVSQSRRTHTQLGHRRQASRSSCYMCTAWEHSLRGCVIPRTLPSLSCGWCAAAVPRRATAPALLTAAAAAAAAALYLVRICWEECKSVPCELLHKRMLQAHLKVSTEHCSGRRC